MADCRHGLTRQGLLRFTIALSLVTLMSVPVVALLAAPLTPMSGPQALPPSLRPLASETAIRRGIDYVLAQYDPETGLLRESPNWFPNRYWVFNDNAIAAHVLEELGEQDMADALYTSLQTYGYQTNNRQEVLWGVPVDWPPRYERRFRLSTIGSKEVWMELCDSEWRYDECWNDPSRTCWRDYTNLAMLGALNELSKGNEQAARQIYDQALQAFDGLGFKDKAFDGGYETYKLALALHTGSRLEALTPTMADNLAQRLLSQQASTGGFFTHYMEDGTSFGDTDTETTSLALLALHNYQPGSPGYRVYLPLICRE
ncbi:MAG: hypothetical protein ACUVX1_10575 [Chloroflexota bacterium]